MFTQLSPTWWQQVELIKTSSSSTKRKERCWRPFSGHSKKVTDVLFHRYTVSASNTATSDRDIVFSASADKTVRFWSHSDSGYTCTNVVKTHTAEVTQLTLHPLGDYLVSCSLDRSWAFHDIHTGTSLVQKFDSSSQAGFTSAQFHPDGLILGTGRADSIITIWDIKSQANVASFEGHSGKVVDMVFSENGYYMASVAEDAQIKLWDLRKLKNFLSLTLEDGNYNVNRIALDSTGSFLAVAGDDVRVFVTKTLSHVQTWKEHKGLATDLQFGPDASFLATTSLDRNLKILSLSE
eukprot:TRINITY_DN1880_c0_g1_i4.p2 TRINITY_DN1880_c0_g1~~TRINITY_DN1880_c0_g1_i4.p2  ORF type:complete len:294 (-),score=85.37 TRINITY_DN1880_c0_g1_i4:23-904(-)